MGGTKSNIELITQDKKEQKGYKKHEDDNFISNSQSEKPKYDRRNGNILEQQAGKNPLYDKSPSDKSFNDKTLNSELSNSWLASRKVQKNNRLSNSNILYEKPYQYEPPPIKPIKKPKPQSNPFPNPYGNHRPDFGMPPISKITQILKKLKPRKKPLNSFVLEAIKLLGGRGQVNTPLTKQHGEKLISARHDLPMHAPLSEKQNIYDIEEKAFETMQKPNATLGDFFKNIGAIDDNEQQPKDRSEVQKARIDMAKKRRFAEQQIEMGVSPYPQMKREAVKSRQVITPEGNLRLETVDDGNSYNRYAGQQYTQADTGIVSDSNVSTESSNPRNIDYPATIKEVDTFDLYDQLDFDPEGDGQYDFAIGSPSDAIEARNLSIDAESMTKKLFSNSKTGTDDDADAFRHAYWSYLMAQDIGVDGSKAAGDGHEITNVNNEGQRLMDLYNNKLGRELALDPANKDRPAEEVIMEAVKSGKLRLSPFRVYGDDKMLRFPWE